jgi:hypothetical protein
LSHQGKVCDWGDVEAKDGLHFLHILKFKQYSKDYGKSRRVRKDTNEHFYGPGKKWRFNFLNVYVPNR